MSNIFIGWGGNEKLAQKLEKKFKDNGHNIVMGGGAPNQMFVGNQIIEQMKSCDKAILLVENYKGSGFSTNLMYEWGYLVGYRRMKRIHAFLIDKPKSDLPSDLDGVWAEELTRKKMGADDEEKSDDDLAEEVYNLFVNNLNKELPVNYFKIIDDWQYISRDLESDKDCYNSTEFTEYIVIGCLAAYYYNDNQRFRDSLDKIASRGRTGEIVSFAKIYVDVFLKSGDMSCALSANEFMAEQSIKRILNRRKETVSFIEGGGEQPSVLDDIIDILCYDILGLINLLYLKDTGLDAHRTVNCKNNALDYFNKTIKLIDKLDARFKDSNDCLIYLLRSYIYNDLAHLYRDVVGDEEEYAKNLEKPVENRFILWDNFKREFPTNVYMSDKLQQEYFIALSEQCLAAGDGASMSYVAAQYKKWKDEAKRKQKTEYTNRLLARIKENLDKQGQFVEE